MTQLSGAIAKPVVTLLQPATNDQIQEYDFSVDLLQTILWQYNNAPNLQALLNAKDEWYQQNQTQFWQDWLVNVFDLRTANQFGLVVWSIILNFPVYVDSSPNTQPTFGFQGSGRLNFGNSNFNPQSGSSEMLPIETQRRALQLRYIQLTSAGCVPEINRALKFIFGDLGTVFLIDYGNMTQRYIFNFPVSADLIYLFNNFDILPRPAGVQSSYTDATLSYFGFGPSNVSFNQGNFGD